MKWMIRRNELPVQFKYLNSPRPGANYRAFFTARHQDARLTPAFLKIKQKLKALFCIDTDDYLWDVDRMCNPVLDGGNWTRDNAKLLLASVTLHFDLADLITVTTPALAAVMSRWKNIRICPNLIDLEHFIPQPYNADSKVILYSGGATHRQDLELVRDLYYATCRDWSWVFYGCRPLFNSTRAVILPWGPVREYPRFCQLVKPRVVLSPLEPSSFDDCKSPIKVWEGATYGGSVLASNTGPYKGNPGAIVPEGEDFTLDHFMSVIEKPNYAECLAIAKDNAWQNSTGAGYKAWVDFYKEVIDLANEISRCRDGKIHQRIQVETWKTSTGYSLNTRVPDIYPTRRMPRETIS